MITVIGCGFVGGLFVEELCKRLYAFERSMDFLLVDFDLVEPRNAANQIYRPIPHAEEPKAMVMMGVVQDYGMGAEALVLRVDKDNIADVLSRSDLVVSAVDNMETRTLLWYYCRGNDIPLLHLGVSQGGIGAVEWTFSEDDEAHDTWSLSPIALRDRKTAFAPVAKLPPCELIGFRGLGLNVGLAGAKAVAIAIGLDPEYHVSDPEDQLEHGFLTTWSCSGTTHEIIEGWAPHGTYVPTRGRGLLLGGLGRSLPSSHGGSGDCGSGAVSLAGVGEHSND